MNEQIIVTLPSSSLRALGREALKDKWKPAVIASLIYYVAILVPTYILIALFDDVTGTMSNLYTLLVSGPFTYGYSMFLLNLFRKKEFDYAQVFSGFERFFKTLGLYLLMSLFIFLWTLLFIIPGVIAAIRYSQSFLILLDHPEYSVFDCLNESKRIMSGNKSKYFCLLFSFLGWMLLACVPTMIVEMVFGAVYTSAFGVFMYSMVILVSMAGYLWVMPYMQVSTIAMYEIMVGNLQPMLARPQAQPGSQYTGQTLYDEQTRKNAENSDYVKSEPYANRRNDYEQPTPYGMAQQEAAAAAEEAQLQETSSAEDVQPQTAPVAETPQETETDSDKQ